LCPIAEPSLVAELQASAPQEGFAVPVAVFVVVGVEDVHMLAVPFVACPHPVSVRPVSVRPVSVRPVSVRPVSVRLASVSALSAWAELCGVGRCGAVQVFGRPMLAWSPARVWRDWCGGGCAGPGEASAADLAAVLGCARAAAAATSDAC
jgi:hypothetical protein